PCPPTSPQSYEVTFTVSGLPSESSVLITYDWRLQNSGGGGKGSVDAVNGANRAGFRSAKGITDSVVVDWSTADGLQGTSNAVMTCEAIR
ncbi:MAG: hypothetical protein ACJ786_37930, partial [Catenulispora sp.]